MKLHIVLHEPEIPQNTGNIARTCAAIGASLHLIQPLGFSIDEKSVRRAGLDYWDLLDLHTWNNIDEFLSAINPANLFLATTKGNNIYDAPSYPEETYLLFGAESKGLPEELLHTYPLQAVRIPIIDDARSLNLSNAVAIMAYEVHRQFQFAGLKQKGQPVSFSWDSE